MILNAENFILYAANNYDASNSTGVEEFHSDLKRFQHLKTLFTRYNNSKDIKLQMIINHIIIIYNCFGLNATNMLFFKLKEYHSYLKSVLMFLNYMPECVEYNNEKIYNFEIIQDEILLKELQKL